ncbi:MAG: hypothetical protein ACLQU1_39475 [Bryobacteraceae bacterium]
MFETTERNKGYYIGAPTWMALGAASLVAFVCLSNLNSVVLVPLAQQREAASWRNSPCIIVSSRLVVDKLYRGRLIRAEVMFRVTATLPDITEGPGYTNERFAFDSAWWTASRSKAFVADYPAGKRTSCYVNPNPPYDAVLVRDVHVINPNSIGFSGLALASLVVCLGLLIRICAVMRGAKPEE